MLIPMAATFCAVPIRNAIPRFKYQRTNNILRLTSRLLN